MKTFLRSALVALIIAATSPFVVAAGWVAVLRDTPAEDFNDEDVRQFFDAVKQSLEAPGPPQALDWRNAESGAGGSVLVLGERKMKNFDLCRRVRFTLYSKKRKGYPTVYTACKDPASGRWLLAGAG